MDITDTDIECSVMVCNYRPNWEKLRLTLKSILMQENCNYKIVVTDDGSEDNFFDKVREYFAKYSFTNYELVASPVNRGTVCNVLQGINACEGEFVRPASPGDFLHGKRVLREWVDFMRSHRDCIMSFCDAIYYHMENGKVVVTKQYAHPQWTHACGKGTIRKYLIFDDICLGAASMFRREQWKKYLEMIVGKVVYAEDNSYRIMMYRGEKFAYLPRSFLLYECGEGISTSGSAVWGKRLEQDWQATNKIMLSLEPCEEARMIRVPEFLHIASKKSWWYRLQRWCKFPSRLLYRKKTKLFPRMTPVEVDKIFVHDLLQSELL